jgi:hypothetical protein
MKDIDVFGGICLCSIYTKEDTNLVIINIEILQYCYKKIGKLNVNYVRLFLLLILLIIIHIY